MKILVLISYLAMILLNALANVIPLGGMTTGEVSDAYTNLFTPAGITFSIWGVIYFFLAVFVIYQFKQDSETLPAIRKAFIASAIANMLWLTAWHTNEILASLIVMIGLLICLIWIAFLRSKGSDSFWSVQVPFGLYFGWITVATIANVTVFLVSLGLDVSQLAQERLTALILLVGLAIGIRTMTKFRDIPYGLVFIWANLGILLKQLSETGYQGQYIRIILAALFSVLVFSVFIYKIIHDDFIKDTI